MGSWAIMILLAALFHIMLYVPLQVSRRAPPRPAKVSETRLTVWVCVLVISKIAKRRSDPITFRACWLL